jgi:site-specific DNA recombinase
LGLARLTGMLEAAQRKDFQTLVVPNFDRFARSMVKGLVLEEQLKKYGVRVIYQRVPLEDTPEGILLKHQLFSFAEFEREKIRLRTMTGRQRKAQLGQVVGVGGPPFGYRFTYTTVHHEQRVTDLEPDPIDASIALRVLRAVRQRSTVDVADELNYEGVPWRKSGKWTAKLIQRIATNPVYAGTWIYGRHGRHVTPDNHGAIGVPVPALISRDEWDSIQRAFAHRRLALRGQIPRDEDPYLLRGLLTCGHCQGALQSQPNRGTRYYQCARHTPSLARRYGKPRCDLPDVYAVDLEAELWRLLSATLLDEDYLAAGLEAARTEHANADRLRLERLVAVETEIDRQRERLEALASRFADAGNSEVFAALIRQAKEIETLIERLAQERTDLAGVQGVGLSEHDATAVEDFAAEIRTGLPHTTPQDRRQLYELLQARGKVYADADGVPIGRKHHYRIDWQAAIQLPGGSSRFRKPVALFNSGSGNRTFAIVAA